MEYESLREISIGDRNKRSKVAEEIINSAPDFLEKYGLPIFLGFLLLLFAFTWFISYPDVVQGKAVLIAEGKIHDIGMPMPVKIGQLVFRNGELVHRGDTIVWVQEFNSSKSLPIVSPDNGVVLYTPFLQVGNWVKPSILLFEIVPTNRSCYARIFIPQKDLSKVDTGMKVELQLDAFPYQEYGVITGRLCFISNSISEEGCYAVARLDEGKKTDLGKAIASKDGLTGTAIVIVRERRLFQQLTGRKSLTGRHSFSNSRSER